MEPAYFAYWGKARPDPAGSVACHRLPFHLLDVAAVMECFLAQRPGLVRFFSERLVCSSEAFTAFACFIAATHDIGKFASAFQGQCEALHHRFYEQPAKTYRERHDTLGFSLWLEIARKDSAFEAGFGADSQTGSNLALHSWIRAGTGHHGMPPEKIDRAFLNYSFFSRDYTAARDFIDMAAAMFLTPESRALVASEAFQTHSDQLSWWFAGAMVLADWLGSETKFFRYRDRYIDLNAYYRHARRRAVLALNESGICSSSAAEQPPDVLFPAITRLSPLQQWAAALHLPDRPQIILLEDVTGAGKTEAALLLAHRLMAKGLADGFFIGLPTMATANAMYRRIGAEYRQLFEGNASLTLQHANAKFVEVFVNSIQVANSREEETLQGDETATARCVAWFADHSKAALLAPAGVGTIDQALLAVLHSKHQSLRLLGLFGKVLIVDEVHACDAYMLKLLAQVLIFHARAGGSAILLSATLPNRMKQTLLDAYAQGCGDGVYAKAPSLCSQAYPLASRWVAQDVIVEETGLESRQEVTRTVSVHYETEEAVVRQHILTALERGQAVCWIRNTVYDALETARYFSSLLSADDVTVFHARFALGDRLAIEDKVLHRFGKNSEAADRQGKLLIATQVVEQSLDVDFDVLITDLAPIDRVLQRAGRLHRHVRDSKGDRIPSATGQPDSAPTLPPSDGRTPPQLWVFGPPQTDDPTEDWYKNLLPKADAVYALSKSWLTARLLRQPSFEMPGDARRMIESVFGDVETPPGLAKRDNQEFAKKSVDCSIAMMNMLSLENGYRRDNSVTDWWSEGRTPSRLGDPSLALLLVVWDGTGYRRIVNGAWPHSVVKVRAQSFGEPVVPPARQGAFDAFSSTLSHGERWVTVLPLEVADAGWTGGSEIKDKHAKVVKRKSWRYDRELGLYEVRA